jgi:hypothetical protein
MNAEDVIRRALEAEASTVEVRPDALGTIRDRIGARRQWSRRWLPPLAAATATVAAAAVGVAVLGRPAPPEPPPNPPAASSPAAPTAPRLPVYYVDPDDRLVREYHGTAAGPVTERVRAAVTEMLRDGADDPDYRTAWPTAATVRGVAVDGDVATVDLTAGPPDAVAREQLVWTVTAVTGGDVVRLRVDGGPVGERLTRGPALDVLAPVWLVDPQAGSVNPARIAVYVSAVAADAAVQVRVTQAGRVVHEEPVRLDKAAPARGEGRATLPALPPGEYTVEAYTADGSDAHDVTVR